VSRRPEPNGATLFRDRLLREAGHTVVSIPYFEWDALKDDDARDAYMTRRMDEAHSRRRSFLRFYFCDYSLELFIWRMYLETLFRIILPVALVTIMSVSMSIRRSRRPQRLTSDSSLRLLSQGQRKLLSKLLDVGGFFGADIGGTLSKLVFFLPDKELATRMLDRAAQRAGGPTKSALEEWAAKLTSIHKIAGFILASERYGATGVRDAHLSFRMDELAGSFHFIRFETRRMEGALRLARHHGLNAGMHSICATGGGAHKVRSAASEFERRESDRRRAKASSSSAG
jgi:hypothetical protein